MQGEGRAQSVPMALALLKTALSEAEQILKCSSCTTPHSPIASWRQNTLFMITLLSSIACLFEEILHGVDAEASALHTSNQKKTMRMGQLWSVDTAHLHTGTPNCPMAFSIELEALEWRSLAFRSIKHEINGVDEGRNTLQSLVTRLERRQQTAHDGNGVIGQRASSVPLADNGAMCVQLTKSIWDTIQNLPV